MAKESDETLEWYAGNAEAFAADTENTDLSDEQRRFAALLPAGGRILELGCGAGRDALAFLRAGFEVEAADGSPELCRIAGRKTGLAVRCLRFEEVPSAYAPKSFDGIWACASLLHVRRAQLPGLLEDLASLLRPNGLFYASFKLGEGEKFRGGRFYSDLTPESAAILVAAVPSLAIISARTSEDARPAHAGEMWLNLTMKKSAA
jgi:SAM-dependent methyltransferase